jgi:hypothetical protein
MRATRLANGGTLSYTHYDTAIPRYNQANLYLLSRFHDNAYSVASIPNPHF